MIIFWYFLKISNTTNILILLIFINSINLLHYLVFMSKIMKKRSYMVDFLFKSKVLNLNKIFSIMYYPNIIT